MTMVDGYTPLATHHCETGSMLEVYRHAGSTLSEEMLLGLGEGVGFMYRQQKGQPPILGGRGGENVAASAGARTGVRVTTRTTTSARKARATLLDGLERGTPVMVQVDMGYLPYFDFGGEEYHFGGHVIVVWGYDPDSDSVLVADRDEELHRVPFADLERARSSSHKPFPPKNAWWEFDFSEYREPTPAELFASLDAQCRAMLEPPISNFGVKGIGKAADRVPLWPKTMNPEELKAACFTQYVFISPIGGTGGGIFRYMFSRYLAECADLTGETELGKLSRAFGTIADRWAGIGEWFREQAGCANPAARMGEARALLLECRDLEVEAWTKLSKAVS
ncbi:MAG: BtrH N-terminal domain-containing protein [Spirochaetota bacterium]